MLTDEWKVLYFVKMDEPDIFIDSQVKSYAISNKVSSEILNVCENDDNGVATNAHKYKSSVCLRT